MGRELRSAAILKSGTQSCLPCAHPAVSGLFVEKFILYSVT